MRTRWFAYAPSVAVLAVAAGLLLAAQPADPTDPAEPADEPALRLPPTAVGDTVAFTPPEQLLREGSRYRWSFGDGTQTGWTDQPEATHRYDRPGRFPVVFAARVGRRPKTVTAIQTVTRPATDVRPTRSSPIAYDAGRGRVWNVNPDAGTVTAIDAATLERRCEARVGGHPSTLAVAGDGRVWVVVRDTWTLVALNGEGRVVDRVALPRASRPHGVAVHPREPAVFVTLQATGRVLRIDTRTRAVTHDADAGPHPRDLAVTADGRVLVARFISPDRRGELRVFDAEDLALQRVIGLAHDPGPDREDAGRGLPNYLRGPAVSPDGRSAWVAAKKDNIARGGSRDGLPLDFESTVRAVLLPIDLTPGDEAEPPASRLDVNDRAAAAAVAFSPRGAFVFAAFEGSRRVEAFDAYSGALIAGADTGFAPQGLCVSPDGTRLYVHEFLSRSVGVFDTSGFVDGSDTALRRVGRVGVVGDEPLAEPVLAGKRLFYTASDPRMSLDGYLSCASCHLDGGHDGRTWDFTDRGEGLRNTITLRGRAGDGHGPLHWTANFDEVHDFEHDIRDAFGGSGLLDDQTFAADDRATPLGGRKAGGSSDLDALAAYVGSLDAVPPSPHRAADGALTERAVAGRAHFVALRCHDCHGGAAFTDSAAGRRHDVGSLRPSSGGRAGAVLDGLDTPTLKGVWNTAPYLHDGSAETLDAVFNHGPDDGPHGRVRSLTPEHRAELIEYLLQIDEAEPAVAGDRGN